MTTALNITFSVGSNYLRGEFLHLFHALVNIKGVPQDDAIAILRKLNANSLTYRFRSSEFSGA